MEHIGKPALNGLWFIYGKSANSKTTYCLKLAKYLTQFVNKVAYNSLEEGECPSLQLAWERVGMGEVNDKIILLDREPLDVLKKRLEKRRQADIIFIDSVLYLYNNTAEEIIALRKLFPKKLFILIGQEKDGDVWGAKQRKLKYDADVKIRVKGGKALCETRYRTKEGKGGAPFIVFNEMEKKFYAEV